MGRVVRVTAFRPAPYGNGAGKLAAAYHGAACDGRCCPRPAGTGPRSPFQVCQHGRACQYHLAEEARRARAALNAEYARDVRAAADLSGPASEWR